MGMMGRGGSTSGAKHHQQGVPLASAQQRINIRYDS